MRPWGQRGSFSLLGRFQNGLPAVSAGHCSLLSDTCLQLLLPAVSLPLSLSDLGAASGVPPEPRYFSDCCCKRGSALAAPHTPCVCVGSGTSQAPCVSTALPYPLPLGSIRDRRPAPSMNVNRGYDRSMVFSFFLLSFPL